MAFEMVTVVGLGTMRADIREDLDQMHVLAIGAFSLSPASPLDRLVTAGVHASPRT
jgi:hypothetical protein